MPTQVSLLDGALASAGTLAIQTNGTTSAITISSAQVATFVNNPIMTGLTASRAVFTDGSKGLTSNAITGTGNVVMSASPTLTGTIDGAALTLSSSLTLSGGTANGVLYLNGSKVATSGSALTFDGSTLKTSGAEPLRMNNDTAFISGYNTAGTTRSGYLQFNAADISVLATSINQPIGFFINGSEQMRLTSTGLGIGTSSPAAKLEIYNSAVNGAFVPNTLSTWRVAQIRNDQSGTSGSAAGIAFVGKSDTQPAGIVAINGNTTGGIVGLGFLTVSSNQVFERVRITSDGDVGIGTSSPSAKLHVAGTVIIDNADANNELTFSGTQFTNVLSASTSGFQLGTTGAGYLAFLTSNSERARIDSSGNLLVGKTSTGLATGVQLEAAGGSSFVRSASTNSDLNLYVYSTGAGAARFYVGMGGTVYATSTTITAISDQRLKENIQDLDVGLDKIMSLKPRKFDWKAGKGKDKKGDRGWIAQEFEQVFPDMVDTWADPAPEGEEPYKAVNADLIPVLVKAIQEQQAIIEQLKADVAALKGA